MYILRFLAMCMVAPLYKTIPRLYKIFYFLSNAKFLQDDVIDSLSKNLYVLVSVVMLFAFSATFLSAIVNPDILSDKKKGAWAVVKRAFISIVLIVLIPIGFDFLYAFQGNIMQNATIEKLIIGFTSDTYKGNGGQVIAGNLLSASLYPIEDGIEVSDETVGELYSKMITESVEDNISEFALRNSVNIAPSDKNKGTFAFEFDGLICLISGAIACYILLIFAIDMAVRMFKLALLELTAPISILAYIGAGTDTLKSWAKEVGRTYLEVFTRIAAMGAYLLLISNLNTFLESPTFHGKSETVDITGLKWILLLKVILVVGMLIFAKQVPEIINAAFGTKIKSKGGIGGRLKNMAVVGEIASKAWNTHKTTIGLGAAALATGPVGMIAGAGALVGKKKFDKAWNEGTNGSKPLKETEAGRRISQANAYLKGGKKGLDEFNKNDPVYQEQQYWKEKAKKKEISDTAKANVQENANVTMPGLYAKNAEGKIQVDSAVLKDAIISGKIDSTDLKDSMFKNILATSNLNEKEQEVINKYSVDRAKKNDAEFEAGNLTAMKSSITNFLAASSNEADKQRLMNISAMLENGSSYKQIEREIRKVSSMTDANGNLSEAGQAFMKRLGSNSTFDIKNQNYEKLAANLDTAIGNVGVDSADAKILSEIKSKMSNNLLDIDSMKKDLAKVTSLNDVQKAVLVEQAMESYQTKSEINVTDALEKATKEFDASETGYKDMLDKTSDERKKAEIKAYDSVSKDIEKGKKEVKRGE